MPTTYQFHPVEACNMCGALPDDFRVLGVRLNGSQGRNPRSVRGTGVTIVQCARCDLVFPDPQPVPGSLLDHYSMPGNEYWQDGRADASVPSAKLVDRFSRLLDMIGDENAPKSLDVGVGSGQAAAAMQRAGFEVHGFEPIPQFREAALTALGLPEERIRLDGIETAEYPEGFFSLVSFGAVLEHLYDPNTALEKAVRWLRPGGLIVLEVPSSRWLVARIINMFFRIRGTNFVTHTSPMHSPFHLYEFGERAFRANGERLGYRVEALHYEVGSNRSLPKAMDAVLRPLMQRYNTGMQMHLVLRKN